MRKSPCGTFFGLRQRSKRAYTPRADVQSIMDMHLRAHIQIQKYRAARTIRSKICSSSFPKGRDVRLGSLFEGAGTKCLRESQSRYRRKYLYECSPDRLLTVWLGRHGITESLYVREDAVYSSGACPRDNAVCAFRSLFARLPSKPKKFGELFRMFRLAEHSPREAVQCMSCPDAVVICGLCSPAEGPSPVRRA